MSKVAIVYWSGTGNTEAMANAVLSGTNGNGELFIVLHYLDEYICFVHDLYLRTVYLQLQ